MSQAQQQQGNAPLGHMAQQGQKVCNFIK